MKPLKYFLIGSLVLFAFSIFIIGLDGKAEATIQDCTSVHTLSASELEECKMQIESQIEERSLEFNTVAQQTATYRELVSAGEAEMAALNSSNNSARVKIRIINRIIESFQQGE